MSKNREIPEKKGLELSAVRSRNLRQLLLHSSRVVNNAIIRDLNQRGYTDLRSTHTALLSNLDQEGNTITEIAERAGMTKQAMGRIADELEKKGYIIRKELQEDRRARLILFTDTGWELMLESFDVLNSLEQSYARLIGKRQMKSVIDGLMKFVDVV